MSKTVFSSREIAHVWANSDAPYGRSPGNLSFNGDAIKSYSTVIGRRIRGKGKRVAYLLDRHSFSNSTSRSQGRVMQAVDGAPVFCVDLGEYGQTLELTPAQIRDYYLGEYRKGLALPRARVEVTRCANFLKAVSMLEEAVDVCNHFGLAIKPLQKKVVFHEAAATAARIVVHDSQAKRQERRETREAKREERRALLDAKWVPRWLAGEAIYLFHIHACLLRANVETGEMETSKGARVPLADAERAYRFATVRRARGWHKNGETCPVGMYQLDAVNEAGIVAGCHRVTWAEADRFAALMGWSNA